MYIVTVFEVITPNKINKKCLYYYILQRKFKLKLIETELTPGICMHSVKQICLIDTYAVLL